MTKQEKLNKLKAKLVLDNPCPELAETATNLVFGSGNIDSSVVFIGEAPGKKEDESGEPFVGASGKLLNELLEENDMKREDVYITNIVKFRPPGNRDPKETEKEEFWPYLQEQLSIIKPKVVATLGRHSGLAFNKGLHISADHGKPFEVDINLKRTERKRADEVQGDNEKRTEPYYNTVKGASQLSTQQFAASYDGADSSAVGQVKTAFIVMPLYHPAAAIYNRSLRDTLKQDFSVLKELIK